MAITEFEIIENFRQGAGFLGVALGIGDDCALLEVPEGKQLAVSLDTLVGGVHFPENGDPELIAERVLRVSISDLAAMGAEPLWITLGLTLPEVKEPWVKAFAKGLLRAADQFNVALVGGDTTKGPMAMTIQVHGAVDPGKALLRSNARVNDLVFVTGPVGDGAGALAVIKKELSVDKKAFNYLMGRYYRPRPQLMEGQLLAGTGAAVIDISDGLLADLEHICKQSGVGAQLQLEYIPLSEPLRNQVEFEQAIEWALTGGDDYQLCFTLPVEQVPRLEKLVGDGKMTAYQIGKIVRGHGVQCLLHGEEKSFDRHGYTHFEDRT